MTIRIVCFVIIFLIGITDLYAQDTQIFRGAGAKTCGEFAKDYARDSRTMEILYFTWAQGFMSAFNLESMSNGIAGTKVYRELGDIEGQKASIRVYCNNKPLALYATAVVETYMALPLKQRPNVLQ